MTRIGTKNIELKVLDGTTMQAYLAHPVDSKQHPGILVFQEAFGVNRHIRNITERFAKKGYVALTPELFHRIAPGFEGTYDNLEAAIKYMQALTVEGIEADLLAAHKVLCADPHTQDDHIASIGFCMGGRVSFLANSILPLQASVSFYGGGITGLLNRSENLHAPMLFFWGGLDKHIGPDQQHAVINSLREHGKIYVNVEFSDADHGFFCDERASYNAEAAQQAWALTLAFLKMYIR